jgi:hypothetical protein
MGRQRSKEIKFSVLLAGFMGGIRHGADLAAAAVTGDVFRIIWRNAGNF